MCKLLKNTKNLKNLRKSSLPTAVCDNPRLECGTAFLNSEPKEAYETDSIVSTSVLISRKDEIPRVKTPENPLVILENMKHEDRGDPKEVTAQSFWNVECSRRSATGGVKCTLAIYKTLSDAEVESGRHGDAQLPTSECLMEENTFIIKPG